MNYLHQNSPKNNTTELIYLSKNNDKVIKRRNESEDLVKQKNYDTTQILRPTAGLP